jgi:hypothetical protein
MRAICLSLCAALAGLVGCELYDDTGAPDPASQWSWVCSDGGPAPDSGCVPPPACADAGARDEGASDGGC